MINVSGNRFEQASAPTPWTRRAARKLRAFVREHDQGSALIEVSLMLPIFLMLLTGIFSFAVAFNNQVTLTNAVGAAGQRLQQLRGGTTDPCLDTFNALRAAAPNLVASNISMTVSFNTDTTAVTPTQTGNSCAGSQSYLVTKTQFTINATYPCTLSAYAIRFTNSCVLSARVSEYEY